MINNQRIVFCDFDGTITAVDTFAGMVKEFAPELSTQLMPLIYKRKLTLREGVKKILESIPAHRYSEVINYAENKPTRPGLAELLEFLNSQNVPFVVISSGLRDMVKAVLTRTLNTQQQPLIEQVDAIFAVDIDVNEEYLRVHSEFEGETELLAKVKVMSTYPARETIAIGDSVTDINMALQADVVFARDRLVEYLNTENKPYITWNDFFDVRDVLVQRWQQ